MMKKLVYAITFAIVGMIGLQQKAIAQLNLESNSLFYHSIRIPQNNALNPAFYPSNSGFYLSLPRVNLTLNSPLSIKEVVTHNPGDSVSYIDVNNVLEQLTEDNKFRLGGEVDIIGFGIKFGHTFVTASSKLVFNTALGIPVSAINFLTEGNLDENGDPISSINVLNGDILKLQAYSELAIGLGHKFDAINLTVGAKAKLLNGFINATTTDTRLCLNTSETMDEMSVNAYYKLNVSSIIDFDTTNNQFKPIIPDNVKGFIPQNRGMAFDLGAKFRLGPVDISASILNLSKGIHWTQNVYELAPENEGYFHFDGLSINGNEVLNGEEINLDTLSNYFSQQLDSLNPQLTKGEGYWHSIPTRINVGASINLGSLFRVGLLVHGQFDNGLFTTKKAIDYGTQTFRFNTTLSASMNLANWLELTIGTGITSDSKKVSFFNPGVSLAITPLSIIQVYATLDYISSLYMVDIKSLNFMVGANIIIGHGGSKKL